MEEAARFLGVVPLVVGQFDLDGIEGRREVDVGRLRMHVEMLDEIAERKNLEREKLWIGKDTV